MSLAATVATGMLALMFTFVALVVFATMRQVRDEASRAADERRRFGEG